MTVADRAQGHQARCRPHLLMLRMLAGDDAETPTRWLAMAEVARATAAILAEVEAAGREVRAAAGAVRTLASVRLAAAGDAVPRPGRGISPSCAVSCAGSRR